MASRALLSTFCFAALVGASTANAQGSIELGGFGTYTQFDTSLALKSGAGGGARLTVISGAGWMTFMLEAEGAYSQSVDGPTSIRYIPARARLLYALPLGEYANLLLGAGGVRNDYNDGNGSVSEWGYTGLAGLRVRLGTLMTLRVDGVMDYMANPIGESPTLTRSINRGVHAGLSFPLWSDRRVPEYRREDVQPTPQPAAPKVEEPAPATTVPQPAVNTPAIPQLNVTSPDADRDGVPDTQDNCAATAAGAMVDKQGCEVYRDSDGDGVIDQRDACPATPAGAAIDGRGCVPTKEPERAKDTDRDGIVDAADRCPNSAATDRVDATGCAVLFKPAERSVTLRGVSFASGQDELSSSSLGVLDEVARQLLLAPNVRIEIAGHTDAQGKRTANIKLSLARAEAVRAYLIMRGVPAERLVARGYGPDRPVATNASPIGRAENRRVELRRIE